MGRIEYCEEYENQYGHGRYRSLSSVGRTLLPKAERMHREGMTWREVAKRLRVSHTSLFNWRHLKNGAL